MYERFFERILGDRRLDISESEIVSVKTTKANCRRFKFMSQVDINGNGIYYSIWIRGRQKLKSAFVGLLIFPLEGAGATVYECLKDRKDSIHSAVGATLQWECHDNIANPYLVIGLSHSVELSALENEDIREWIIETLLKLKRVLAPEMEDITGC